MRDLIFLTWVQKEPFLQLSFLERIIPIIGQYHLILFMFLKSIFDSNSTKSSRPPEGERINNTQLIHTHLSLSKEGSTTWQHT